MAGVQVSIRIKNVAQIRRAFGMAPVLMRMNLNKAIRKAFIFVERDSRIFTPVDTGRLRASHRTMFRDLYGELSTNVGYDIFVHEGTSRMRARPYMKRAVEKNEPQVDKLMETAVQDTLDKIGRQT